MICKECGKDFKKKYKFQLYCGVRCKLRARLKAAKLRYALQDKRVAKERDRIKGLRIREIVSDFKLQIGCQLCGYKEFGYNLEFHHTGEKKSLLGQWGRWSIMPKALVDELNECVILCTRCHRSLHHGDI